jgi:hypothetical protein
MLHVVYSVMYYVELINCSLLPITLYSSIIKYSFVANQSTLHDVITELDSKLFIFSYCL